MRELGRYSIAPALVLALGVGLGPVGCSDSSSGGSSVTSFTGTVASTTTCFGILDSFASGDVVNIAFTPDYALASCGVGTANGTGTLTEGPFGEFSIPVDVEADLAILTIRFTPNDIDFVFDLALRSFTATATYPDATAGDAVTMTCTKVGFDEMFFRESATADINCVFTDSADTQLCEAFFSDAFFTFSGVGGAYKNLIIANDCLPIAG